MEEVGITVTLIETRRIYEMFIIFIHKLVDFDVVANCTGYGARKLVGDYNVVAYSGQVIKSDAMNQKFCITSDKHNAYVIPRLFMKINIKIKI